MEDNNIIKDYITEEADTEEVKTEETAVSEAAEETETSAESEDAAETVEETAQEESFTPEAPVVLEETPVEENESEEESAPVSSKPADPAAAIEAILFATGNSVKLERLAEVLELNEEELNAAIETLKERYASNDRGICLTELEDAIQLGTKGEYYEYLIKLAKNHKRMTLSDTVIETLSIIAYKQPVTRAEIERIRGVSCDHAVNRLLEYDLIEEVGRLDAPGKPLLFGTTEQFLRSFGISSLEDAQYTGSAGHESGDDAGFQSPGRGRSRGRSES